MKRILIIAGGTGGHIFPALVVARAFRDEGFSVQWLGSRVGMEGDIVAGEFPISFISVRGIRGKSLWAKLLAPVRLLRATWQAWCAIRRSNPDLVLGMGGFVSGPSGLAAWLARKPLVIHEQNAVAGVTNRILARCASTVLEGFPNAFSKRVLAKTIGNPIRPTISGILSPAARLRDREGPLRILILGGSQGARAINEAMIRVLSNYPDSEALQVWHQTGKLNFTGVQRSYRSISVRATVEAFIKNMSEAYAWADLAICRAGALTVSELAAAGVASILIPFPDAVDDHQYYNGRYLSTMGAATLIRQADLTDAHLTQMIQDFSKDRDQLVGMAEKARTLSKPDALTTIISTCNQLTRNFKR